MPGSSSQDTISNSKNEDCVDAGKAIMNLLEKTKTHDIMTKKTFENAITVVIALGGSTITVLHLLAMADAIGVDLNLDDFTRIGMTPVLADLKPFGKYYMSELNANGDVRPLMKTLLDKKLLHGDCMISYGQDFEENLSEIKPYENDSIIKNLRYSIKNNSHIRILWKFSRRGVCC